MIACESRPLALVAGLALFPIPQTPTETVVSSARDERAATETGANRVVLTAEELAATGERSLPRRIAKASGVWLQETNVGGGSPLIQGLSGNQVLLVVDGVRLNDATTRNGVNQILNGIEPATVERVEVIRGPRSVQWGSDALGGVVLVWTKAGPPRARALSGALEARGDSALEGWTGALELGGSLERTTVLGIAGAHRWGDLHAASGENQETGYEGDSLFGSFTRSLGRGRDLRLSLAETRDYDVPRTDRLTTGFGQSEPANAEFDFALQDRRRALLAYDDRSGALGLDELAARLSYRTYEEERHIRATGSDTRRIERDVTQTLGLGLDARHEIGPRQLLTVGLDLEHDEVDSSRTDVDLGSGAQSAGDGSFAPGSRFLAGGVFVQDELDLAPWAVTLGARFGAFGFAFDEVATGEREDGSFTALSGSAAVARELAGERRVVATLARGFRAPNLAELARDATFFGGDELSNPELEPETSLYAELAFEQTLPRGEYALAVFANRIDDVVGSRLIDAGGPDAGDETYLRENIGELQLVGAFARADLGLFGPGSRWSLAPALEWTRGQQYSDFVDPSTGEKTFDDVPGQRIPPLHGQLALRHDTRAGALGWVELTAAWALEQDRLSPQDLGDPRIDPAGTDGWLTFDLDCGGALGSSGSHWFAGLHNLFDADYRVHGSGFDAAGFGAVAGLRLVR